MASPTFERLRVWHEARQLVREIYEVARNGEFARDFGLRDQICRAAVSVMANIAEGYERGSRREFLQFLKIAKGSAGELRSHLYAAEDLGYVSIDTAMRLREHAAFVARQLAVLARKAKS